MQGGEGKKDINKKRVLLEIRKGRENYQKERKGGFQARSPGWK